MRTKINKTTSSIFVSMVLSVTMGFAASKEAPVVQADQNQHNAALATPMLTVSDGNTDIATKKLQQQVDNLVKMNLPQQMDDLQQQMAKLSGEMAILQHDVQLLNSQQRSFYQDLNQRIQQVSNLVNNDSGSGNNDVPNALASSSTSSSAASTSSKSSNASAAPTLNSKEDKAYQAAVDLVRARHFDKATQALHQYLTDYPNGQYTGNIHYWLGEIAFQQQKDQQAMAEFTTVVTHFEKATKALDAQLKLANLLAFHDKQDQAVKNYQAIIKKAPDSAEAHLAKIKLNAMQNLIEDSAGDS